MGGEAGDFQKKLEIFLDFYSIDQIGFLSSLKSL